MSFQRYDPNTIHLGGPLTVDNTLASTEAITPGMLIERTTLGWRKHTTAGGATNAVALDHPMANKGVDDDYASGDLVEACLAAGGTAIWGLIASGQALAKGVSVESAGNGTVRALASGVALYKTLEAKTVTTLMRIRLEKL